VHKGGRSAGSRKRQRSTEDKVEEPRDLNPFQEHSYCISKTDDMSVEQGVCDNMDIVIKSCFSPMVDSGLDGRDIDYDRMYGYYGDGSDGYGIGGLNNIEEDGLNGGGDCNGVFHGMPMGRLSSIMSACERILQISDQDSNGLPQSFAALEKQIPSLSSLHSGDLNGRSAMIPYHQGVAASSTLTSDANLSLSTLAPFFNGDKLLDNPYEESPPVLTSFSLNHKTMTVSDSGDASYPILSILETPMISAGDGCSNNDYTQIDGHIYSNQSLLTQSMNLAVNLQDCSRRLQF